MSKVTVMQAAELTGKHRDTINAATKKGKLSFELNEEGTKVIDVSELSRKYTLVKKPEDLGKKEPDVVDSSPPSEADVKTKLATVLEQLKHREEIKQLLEQERERERQQLQDEIDRLNTALENAQEQANKAMLLITDQTQSGAGETNRKIEELRDQIAAQNVAYENSLSDARSQARRDAIKEIKSHSFFTLPFHLWFSKKLRA